MRAVSCSGRHCRLSPVARHCGRCEAACFYFTIVCIVCDSWRCRSLFTPSVGSRESLLDCGLFWSTLHRVMAIWSRSHSRVHISNEACPGHSFGTSWFYMAERTDGKSAGHSSRLLTSCRGSQRRGLSPLVTRRSVPSVCSNVLHTLAVISCSAIHSVLDSENMFGGTFCSAAMCRDQDPCANS